MDSLFFSLFVTWAFSRGVGHVINSNVLRPQMSDKVPGALMLLKNSGCLHLLENTVDRSM